MCLGHWVLSFFLSLSVLEGEINSRSNSSWEIHFLNYYQIICVKNAHVLSCYIQFGTT